MNRFFQYVLFTILIFSTLISCKQEAKKDSTSQQKDIDPVLQELNALIDKNPKDAQSYFTRAKYFYDHKGYDEAILDLASAIQLDSLKPDYYHLLADTYIDYYQSKMALYTLQKALGLFPENIHTKLKLTEFQIIMKQYDESMQTIRMILDQDPQNADAYLLMGTTLEETGDFRRAHFAYKKATEIDPYLVDAWIKAGKTADVLKDKNAINYYETALRIDTTGYEPMYAMALFYQFNNNNAKAIEWYQKVIAAYPSIANPVFNLGVIYQEMDSLDKALSHFEMASNIDQLYGEAYYAQGVVLEKQGKIDPAWRKYAQAASIMPKFQKAHDGVKRMKELLDKEAKK